MNVPHAPSPIAPHTIPDDPRTPALLEDGAAVDEERLYLAGRPSLRGFVQYVQAHAREPIDRASLVEEWQAARAWLTTLERQEPGAADHPAIASLPPRYEPLLVEFFKNPLVRRSFNTLPTDIALVPLDPLVVYQKHIDLVHVRRLRERLGAHVDEAAVFRMCLPGEPPRAPVAWSGTRRGQFVFVSPSNDLRYLGASALEPGQLAGSPSNGTLVGMVGLAVGFGSNFLNAFHAAGRLILTTEATAPTRCARPGSRSCRASSSRWPGSRSWDSSPPPRCAGGRGSTWSTRARPCSGTTSIRGSV